MAAEIYILKTETINGIETDKHFKLVDNVAEVNAILGTLRITAHDFGFDGIYGHSGTSYAYVPKQVMIPLMSDIGVFTKIEAKYIMDYETEGASTMDAQLYNYTNSVAVTSSQASFPNQTWGHGASGWIDVTAYQGKSIRLGTKRVGGVGSNNIKVESTVVLLKFT